MVPLLSNDIDVCYEDFADVCVCVSSLTVGLRLLYFGGADHASSAPHY